MSYHDDNELNEKFTFIRDGMVMVSLDKNKNHDIEVGIRSRVLL